MRRRDFIIGAGGVVVWPHVARAQPHRLRRVGVLLLFSEGDPEGQRRIKAFDQGMADHGWTDGRNVQIVFRFAGGDYKRMVALASELAGLPVDLIVTNALSPVLEGTRDRREIPIVIAMVVNPVVQGVLVSLARPGRNITGLTTFDFPTIFGKWLQLLKTIAPRLECVGILYGPDAYYSYLPRPVGSYWLKGLESFAPSFGVRAAALPVRSLAEMDMALAEFAKQPGGLVIAPDTYVVSRYERIATLAMRDRLPGCYPYNYFAAAGGLMSYGPNGVAAYRQVATYVDGILKGAKARDLPITRPRKYDLILNLKTAKALDLKVPRQLLIQADQVIE